MKLYHFTAMRFAAGIRKEGLTKGGTPVVCGDGTIKMFTNTQWMTRDKKWDQAFHDPESKEWKYDRREMRLTIVIPKSQRFRLADKKGTIRIFKGKLLPDFFSHPDCDDWCLFYGTVKPQWIRNVVINPKFKG